MCLSAAIQSSSSLNHTIQYAYYSVRPLTVYLVHVPNSGHKIGVFAEQTQVIISSASQRNYHKACIVQENCDVFQMVISDN